MKIQIYPILVLFSLAAVSSVSAQKKAAKAAYIYTDAQTLTKNGQWPLNTSDYQRVDSTGRVPLPATVQALAHWSSGINIMFQTDSKSIAVKWKIAKYRTIPTMTAVSSCGLDLYGWNGTYWQHVGIGIPRSEVNTDVIVKAMAGKMTHYRLYLPIGSEPTQVEIGIDPLATIKPADARFVPKKRVVIYGSSITQGTAASRPGMTYTSILSRRLGVETINLGFNGSGKIEIELAEAVARIPADVYVLDCVPNPSPQEIKERTYPFVKKLRTLRPNTPIVMIESITRERTFWDLESQAKVKQQNVEFKTAYKKLLKDGEKQLYYLSTETLNGDDHESSVDGTHLTDLGFMRLAETVAKTLKTIL
ncbi:SGNH/GDSL hydrolase family protein [Pedobacter heparinus]|uniref:Hydrolase n=1 Tax=Pedobacter heparinus (strain ATCC 13125 / DSM 2366 / CIP 104194 / JCM 7457 / NBRC 12017 / NCIMB 9290 / NRRL B-14731 / HIM 762-3) TaxID=485917 RepID=C6XTT2_PEDHD|nr:SGNH/GDSL hydrolase family protein [Pedobacter heparinus]ACU03718.1 hypothetical protein Phep_1504 [Pedobacter heparinus DSM 2366]